MDCIIPVKAVCRTGGRRFGFELSETWTKPLTPRTIFHVYLDIDDSPFPITSSSVVVQVHARGTTIQLMTDAVEVDLYTESTEACLQLLTHHVIHLLSLLLAVHLSREPIGFLLVDDYSSSNTGILGVIPTSNSLSVGSFVRRSPPLEIPGDFFLAPEDAYGRNLYRLLFDESNGLGLPPDFPILGTNNHFIQDGSYLQIRINPRNDWFLAFPLNYFHCQGYSPDLSTFTSLEWIFTEKNFLQNTYERNVIRRDLGDPHTFLKHSAIVVNEYPHFRSTNESSLNIDNGVEILRDIAHLCKDVELTSVQDNEILSLRYLSNPSLLQLIDLLEDSSIKYIFADFHVDQGSWVLGSLCDSPESFNVPMNLLYNKDLSHIRLMRLFHCRSVFDPYLPKDTPSIVERLLAAGAMRVEGSMLQEHFIHYLCSLIHMFLHPQGLQTILMIKSLEIGVDFSILINRANKYLRSHGWDGVV